MLYDGYGNEIKLGNSSGSDSVRELLNYAGNLFDAAAMTPGIIIDGELAEHSGNYVTPFIDVSVFPLPMTVCITRDGAATINAFLFAYDKDKAYIGKIANPNGYATIPANTAYIRAYCINHANYGCWTDGKPHMEMASRTPTIKGDLLPINSRWNGKKVAFLGDSFTAMKTFPKTCAALLCVGDYYNWGLSGRMLNHYADALDTSLASAGITLQDIDLLVVLGGENDFSAGYGVGEIGDGSNGVAASTARLIEHIYALRADMPMCFLTPTYRNGYKGSSAPGADGDTNNGHIRDYATGIKSSCEHYSVPCLDTYRTMGINIFNVATTTRDGLHPTEDKYLEMGWQAAAFIATL